MAASLTESFIVPSAARGAATRARKPTLKPSVIARGLNFWYSEGESKKQVLFDNQLDLLPGEIVIMTGPSGSGKTTLLTLIGGLRSVQEGSLVVLGEELRGLDERGRTGVRKQIGFIFQAHNLFESLTAYQNVHIALELDAKSPTFMRKRAEELLKRLGLGHRLHHKPGALSGGQKQRVAIARALANSPKLILADEPTAALDRESGREVISLFQQVAEEEQATILLVTHDNRILDAAHRIVNMVDGRIISDVHVKESAEIANFLRRCPLFNTLTPGQLGTMADQVSYERHPAGTVLVRRGDPGDKFYVIRAGRVQVSDRPGLTPGHEPELGPGDFFGEVALITGDPRNATIVALDDVELYSLTKDEFSAVLKQSETFEEEFRKIVFERQ